MWAKAKEKKHRNPQYTFTCGGGTEAAAQWVAKRDTGYGIDHDAEYTGIYIRPNPLIADFGGNKHAADKDVEELVELMIDLDPARPAGANSSREELQEAFQVMLLIYCWLKSLGFPDPIVALSGNGVRLLYKISLPPADKIIVRKVLEALRVMLGRPSVKVDTSMFNPCRSDRMYGTVNKKCPGTPDRPARRSCLLHVPSGWKDAVTSRAALEAAAAHAPEGIRYSREGKHDCEIVNEWQERLRKYIKNYPTKKQRAARFRGWLRDKRKDPAIQGDDGRRKSFVVMAKGEVAFDLPHDVVRQLFLEIYNPGCQPPWDEGDSWFDQVQEYIAENYDTPRGEMYWRDRSFPAGPGWPVRGDDGFFDWSGEQEEEMTTGQQGGEEQQTQTASDYKAPEPDAPNAAGKKRLFFKKKLPVVLIKNLATLQHENIPPLRFVLPSFIPEGVTLLAARPKVGKSLLVAQLGLAVSMEHDILGKAGIVGGSVLYLALEDGDRRIQDRITRMLEDEGVDWPANFDYSLRWPTVQDGGLELIDDWLYKHPDARLVVIDTLEFFRPDDEGKRSYKDDYNIICKLKAVADHYRVAIIVVHHVRKEGVLQGNTSSDPIAEVSGTYGLTGAADTILVLDRVPEAMKATLYGRGRDIEEQTLRLLWNKSRFSWEADLSPPEAKRLSDKRQRVVDLLRACPGLTPTEQAGVLGVKLATQKSLLKDMKKAFQVVADPDGCYFVVGFHMPCPLPAETFSPYPRLSAFFGNPSNP